MKLSKVSVLGAAFVTCATCCGTAFSQEEERNYDASIAFGYVGTSGNTETQTFNTEALLTYRTTKWVHNVKFAALGSSEDGSAKAERYYLEDKSDYDLGHDNSYLFVKGSYTDDRFSGFDYQAAVTTGYGHYFSKQDNFTLQGYAGVGYRENDFTGGESVGEAIFALGEGLTWQISETSKLTQDFTTDIGEEITTSKFVVGLESNIINNIVTKIAVELRHTSEVPEGNEKTDTLTSISLVYTF